MTYELARDQWDDLVTAAVEMDLISHDGNAKADYAGRGMIVGASHKSCIAFVIDSDDDILNFGYHLDALLRKAGLDDLDPQLLLRDCRSDSHGQEAILYFPRISVAVEPDTDTDDEDEDEDDGSDDNLDIDDDDDDRQ